MQSFRALRPAEKKLETATVDVKPEPQHESQAVTALRLAYEAKLREKDKEKSRNAMRLSSKSEKSAVPSLTTLPYCRRAHQQIR
jgi:hypothetical protein